jgi:hypothetical protein
MQRYSISSCAARSNVDTRSYGPAPTLSAWPRSTRNGPLSWLDTAGIQEEAIFRRLVGQGHVSERLHEDSVSDIFKRVAAWIGMSAKQVRRVSGHSVRVGATQDLLALNIDLASVMQAGRWKSTRMPMRYGEEVLTARGGMARAAEARGRDDSGQMSK